jgi:diguanylate cyclase (GGDEF)-like protein
MLTSARKKMPAIDYVSIVRSVYNDKRALLMGALAGAVAAGAAAYKSNSLLLVGVAVLFVLVGLGRYWNMQAFWRAGIGAEDAEAAEYWEARITVAGMAAAAVYGLWCFVSVVFVGDDFAELISISVTGTALVGIVARNFGLDRLVTLQALIVAAPLAAGLVLTGDPFLIILAALLTIMVTSFRKLAGDTRALLLNAVHGRVEASRLARELDTALSTMSHGLCMLDSEGRVAVMNSHAQLEMIGGTVSRWVGRPFADGIAEACETGSISRKAADRLIAFSHPGSNGKITLEFQNGSWCEVTANSGGSQTVLVFEDISERVRTNSRIAYLASHDSLTGLPNRAYFTERVEQSLDALAAHGEPSEVMLMIVDIDEFKHINDTFGHVVGDRLLIEVGRRVQVLLGGDTLVSRFGGDEYTVFRSVGASSETAANEAQVILTVLRKPFEIDGRLLSVNASVGFVVSNGMEESLETLLTRADLALYKAKSAGKARWCQFHDDMDVAYKKKQRLKNDLVEALGRNELYLVYQPIVDLKSRLVTGCEALLRWRHPELGIVPPFEFIPIAEENGMMAEITRWVLRTATSECLNWPGDAMVSVNISATDFRSADVRRMVNEALEHSGLPPHRLEVEVTETALIEEREAAVTALSALRESGVGIALDDFGTGYSSLSYLHALPFTKLKIDRSFVVDVSSDPRSLKLLHNIAWLSKDLELTVTVEGIETEEQLNAIIGTSKVDQAQGYLFGAPLPKMEVRKLIGCILPGKKLEAEAAKAIAG